MGPAQELGRVRGEAIELDPALKIGLGQTAQRGAFGVDLERSAAAARTRRTEDRSCEVLNLPVRRCWRWASRRPTVHIGQDDVAVRNRRATILGIRLAAATGFDTRRLAVIASTTLHACGLSRPSGPAKASVSCSGRAAHADATLVGLFASAASRAEVSVRAARARPTGRQHLSCACAGRRFGDQHPDLRAGPADRWILARAPVAATETALSARRRSVAADVRNDPTGRAGSTALAGGLRPLVTWRGPAAGWWFGAMAEHHWMPRTLPGAVVRRPAVTRAGSSTSKPPATTSPAAPPKARPAER